MSVANYYTCNFLLVIYRKVSKSKKTYKLAKRFTIERVEF